MLRRALQTDGSSPVPVLLAADAGEVGGDDLLQETMLRTASSARNVPGGFQRAALDLRDLARGPSRSTPVLAPAPGEPRLANDAAEHDRFPPSTAGLRNPYVRARDLVRVITGELTRMSEKNRVAYVLSGRRASASGRRPQCSGPRSRSCGSVRIVPTISSEPPWAQPAGRSTTMTDRGTPSRFESEVGPPEELFFRVRSAVAATPAAKARPPSHHRRGGRSPRPDRGRPARGVADRLRYRPALRIHEGTPVTFHLLDRPAADCRDHALGHARCDRERRARTRLRRAGAVPGGTPGHADLRRPHAGRPAADEPAGRLVGEAVAVGPALPHRLCRRGPPRPPQFHRRPSPVRSGCQPTPWSGGGRSGGGVGRPERSWSSAPRSSIAICWSGTSCRSRRSP